MTPTEFLLARIDDDENTARCAGHGNGLVFHDWNAEWVQVELPDNARPTYDVRHIRTFSPDRVRSECEAKRRIIDEHTCHCPDPNCRDCGACSGDHHADPTPAPCATLRFLALPYADHPDYDEGWRP